MVTGHGSDRGHTRFPGRHLHWRLLERRPHLLRKGSLAALLAVVGPGVLAGLSDDDPAGITTYSILGAKYGYELLWVLTLSTAALIVFHELGGPDGHRHGQGPDGAHPGALRHAAAHIALGALVIANTGTICAEFAGVSAGSICSAGSAATSRFRSPRWEVPARPQGAFSRIEHVLLMLTRYSWPTSCPGFLAHPDWGARRRAGRLGMPFERDCRARRRSRPSARRSRRGGLRSSSRTRSTSGSTSGTFATSGSSGGGRGPDRRDRGLHRRGVRRDAARARHDDQRRRRCRTALWSRSPGRLASTLFGLGLVGAGSPGRCGRAAVDRLLGGGGPRARAPTSTTASPRRRSSTSPTPPSSRSRRRWCSSRARR